MRMSDFADIFFGILLDIHKDRPNIVAPDIDVINDYEILRSEVQGATTRSQPTKVTEYVINCMNRWNIGEEDVGHGHMRVVYSERKQMLNTFLVFSLPL